MNIPMVDLKSEYAALRGEIEPAVLGVLESAHFILGPNVKALEQEAAAYLGAQHAVAVASGTDALHLALRAAGVQAGDQVITTPFTFIATAEAISYIGATPVFVDIDPSTYNIDPALIEAAITPRTRAVLPVHLYGQPADLAPIAELCSRRGLALVEDCAQSFGARYAGRQTGTFGAAGCFSFYPSKNLGCYGDGGMIVTNDDGVAERVRVLRDHGSRVRYHHSEVGYNSRLDEIQAAILRVKLRRLDEFNDRRRAVAAAYTARFAGTQVVPPAEDGKGVHVYHQYTVRVPDRDAVQKALADAGIASAIYYPIPLHRQEAYAAACAGVSLHHAECAAREVLSLPVSPWLSAAQVEQVTATVLAAAG